MVCQAALPGLFRVFLYFKNLNALAKMELVVDQWSATGAAHRKTTGI